MRLLLFTDTLGDVNGVARWVMSVARHAAAHQLELLVVTSTRVPMDSMAKVVNVPPIAAMKLPGYADLQIVWPDAKAIRAIAEQFKPEVIHVSTPGPVGLVGRRIARTLGVPLVGTYHTNFPNYVRVLLDDEALAWTTEGALRWFYKPFDRVLTRSSASAVELERGGWNSARLRVITPGVDTDSFNPGRRDPGIWSRALGCERPGTKVLCLGRVSREKNLSVLARMWPTIHRQALARGSSCSLVFVGDGPMRGELELTLESHSAIFLGTRHGHELAALIASSDLLIFPSTTDTLGQAVLESLASGVPAIVSNVGGPSSLVCDHHTGRVVDPQDGDAWVHAAVELITNASARDRMGRQASQDWSARTIGKSIDCFWALNAEVQR